jgi:ABC-type transport system substrate-binding protein
MTTQTGVQGRLSPVRLAAMLGAALLVAAVSAPAAQRGGTLTIGMTASDIPYTGGQPDQGGEGFRFVGYQIYDALILWDLSRGDRLPPLVPGLAESWEVRKDDPTRWVFKLRRGVKFHDGSPFNAEAVLFTFESIKNKEAPHFDPAGSRNVSFRLALLKSIKKLDDYTVEFETTRPTSFVPYQVVFMMIVSPSQWEKVGRDWRKFAERPSGTGPFRVTRFVPRERLELEANRGYWDGKRIPKVDKVVLRPMPEPTTRLSALRTGEVDWIEVPPPDAIPQLQAAGFQIVTGPYPHNWTHTLRLDAAPWNNKLLRKAANYAIDREGICKALLNGICIPATGVVYRGHPWFGQPKETYTYDPAKAKALVKQAGFGDGKRVKATHLISTGGSGQMLPLQMNELIQKDLREVGIDLELQPIEWNALLARWRAGFHTPENQGLNAWNISWTFDNPWMGFGRFFHSKSVVPVSVNTMPYINPEVDKLLEQAEAAFDLKDQDRILSKVHEVIVDDAPWIFIVHDLNARGMNKRVKGFVQPQSWFVDLTLPSVN